MLGDVEEAEEQKMARFLHRLNYKIFGMVELYPYSDFDTLCSLCLKLEAQGKAMYVGSFRSDFFNPKPWVESETSMKVTATTVPTVASSSIATPMLSSVNKETNFSKPIISSVKGLGIIITFVRMGG